MLDRGNGGHDVECAVGESHPSYVGPHNPKRRVGHMVGPAVHADDLVAKAREHDREIGTCATDVEHLSGGREIREDERTFDGKIRETLLTVSRGSRPIVDYRIKAMKNDRQDSRSHKPYNRRIPLNHSEWVANHRHSGPRTGPPKECSGP